MKLKIINTGTTRQFESRFATLAPFHFGAEVREEVFL